MNRSFRAAESGRTGSLRMKDGKDEDLALFREMRKRDKERNDLLLLQSSDEFDAPLGPKSGSSPIFNLRSGAPAPTRKPASDDFLNSENDKNDYDWLLTPPGTPLFPSLEMESHKTVMSQLGTPKGRPTALRSRLANHQPEPPSRSSLSSRQLSSSGGLNTSSGGLRRPSSSGGSGSRPVTPTGRPILNSSSRSLSSSANNPSLARATKPTTTSTSSSSKTTPHTSTKLSRSSTPTSRPTITSSKPTPPARSSTPTRSAARPSTPTSRPSIPSATKSTSRASTPTRRPTTTVSSVALNKSSNSLVSKPAPSTTMVKNPVPSRPNSPSARPRPWKPSEMPGYSLDAPPNLRTSLADRPPSVTRGRTGAPSSRSSSIEPASNSRTRRQSCSPARGRPPNGLVHTSGSSVPVHAVNRLHAKANANISPVLVGTKMVERVINMRKLGPPNKDDRHSPHSNLSGKSSSSPDSSGFGRTLSKKSLDMAIRHMDIRRTVPGNLRPLMTNFPASSIYSVRSGGPNRSRTVSVSDSPLATSSNASSEVSVNYSSALYVNGHEVDDDVSSDKGIRSPPSLRGR